MQRDSFSGASTSITLLVLIIIILTIFIGSLLAHNKSYKQENRGLVIQNDSILSVNAELKAIINSIPNQKDNRATTTMQNKNR